MSTEVENRVVEMKFNNTAFEKGVSKTLGTLDALKSKLNFTGSTKGLKDLQTAGNNFSLAGIGRGVDDLNKKFSTLNIVGVATLANLATKAVSAGAQLIKSFTINPITDGFSQYQQQINATQTVLANTSANGGNLKNVTATLAKLNEYANATIYNFSDMATNLGTFTSAGIKLGPASDAIQGLSNVAAAAGAGTQQAAGAMYQLSQALGRGKLTAQDWNSVVAAGMASSNFKTAILETAKAVGTIKMPKTQSIEEWTKQGHSFQDAMSKGQLTSDVLIQTLQVMTGNMTDAQLAAKGYTKEQIKSLQAMAAQAKSAATNVKTVSALVDNLRQGVGSAYAQVFKTLMGDLPTATKNLTQLSGVLNHIFVDPVNNLNKMLQLSKHWGSDINLYKSVTNVFKALAAIIKPIKDAFRQVFPPLTARHLASILIKFRKFTETLIISKGTAENLKKTFVGVFTVLKIVVGIVLGAVRGFFNLLQVVGQLVPGVLALTGVAGQFVTTLAKWLVFKNPIGKLFTGLGTARAKILLPLAHVVSLVAEALAKLFSGDYKGFTSGIKTAFGGVGDVISALRDVIVEKIQSILDSMGSVGTFLRSFGSNAASSTSGFVQSIGKLASTVGEFLGKLSSTAGKSIIDTVNNIAKALSNLFQNLSFTDLGSVFDGFGTGASNGVKSLNKLSVVGSALKKIWDGVANVFKGFGKVVGPAAKTIGQIFQLILDRVKNFISGMDFQDAIALLNTGFLIALYKSFSGFFKSISGTVNKLGDVFDSASKTLDTLQKSLKTMQQNVKSKIILRIAVAVALLAGAVYVLAGIDPKKLATAVGAMTALFAELVGSLAILGKFNLLNQTGVLKTAAAFVLLAVAIGILTFAIKLLSKMSWKELSKGLEALGLMVAGLGVIVRVMNGTKGVFAAAAGMVVLAFALTLLAGVLVLYSKFDSISKSLSRLIIVVAGLAIALNLMPFNLPSIAAGMVVLSVALTILARVLKTLGDMHPGQIAKALITLGVALAIIVVAANSMEAALPGAAAMLVMAGALKILTGVLKTLGSMSLGAIIKSLLALAGMFIIISAASVLLSPAIPFIAAFGAALLILGAAMLVAGAGFYLFATGLGIVAAVGAAVIGGFLQLIPLFMQQLGLGLIAFAKVVSESAPKLAAAFTVVILAIITSIVKIAGAVIDAIATLILKLVAKVVELTPVFVQAGITMLLDFMQGIDDNIYRITTLGVDIIKKFLQAIGDQAPTIVSSAFTVIGQFVAAIASAIQDKLGDFSGMGKSIAWAIADGLTFGLAGKAADVAKAAAGLASDAYNGAKSWLHVNSPSKKFIELGKYTGEGFVIGMNAYSKHVGNAAENMGANAVDKLQGSIKSLHEAFSTNVDMTPVIAPVIDLTEVRKGAARMSTLLAANPLTTDVSFDQAKVVSTEQTAAQQNAVDSTTPAPVTQLTYNQTNNSPEPLSTTDIYRKTNNQLALARKALGIPA